MENLEMNHKTDKRNYTPTIHQLYTNYQIPRKLIRKFKKGEEKKSGWVLTTILAVNSIVCLAIKAKIVNENRNKKGLVNQGNPLFYRTRTKRQTNDSEDMTYWSFLFL